MSRLFYLCGLLAALFIAGCTSKDTDTEVPEQIGYTQAEIQNALDRYKFIKLSVPEDQILEPHRPALQEMLLAAQFMNPLYLEEVASENHEWREQITDPATRQLFDIMFGRCDRKNNDQPFWGKGACPLGATFYPPDLTKEDGEQWVEDHPEQKDAFYDPYTVVRQDEFTNELRIVPYCDVPERQPEQELAAVHLENAADLAVDPRLAKFLRAKALAFRTNTYTESDLAWLKLGDGYIDFVIGPTEAYDDALFGKKASSQAYISLRNQEASDQLAELVGMIADFERALPLNDEYRTKPRGLSSDIFIGDMVYSSGAGNSAMVAMAFNLPNDKEIRENVGTRNVILMNVIRAKFDHILKPLAEQMMTPEQAAKVTFRAFFMSTLLHEISHALDALCAEDIGRSCTAIEEAKADILGVYLELYLVKTGYFEPDFQEEILATTMATNMRSARFGVSSSHGKSTMIQFNWQWDNGAIYLNEDGRYVYDSVKMAEAATQLSHELLMIKIRSDKAEFESFIVRYGYLSDHLANSLSNVQGVPVDVHFSFPIEEWAKNWTFDE